VKIFKLLINRAEPGTYHDSINYTLRLIERARGGGEDSTENMDDIYDPSILDQEATLGYSSLCQ